MVRGELRQAVVVKAGVWKGSGIGQAQLSRFIYQWTGVRIMTSDWSKYRGIVVCALALYYRLLNVPKDLSNGFADAAFMWYDKLEVVNDDKDEEDDEKKPVAVPWDASHVPLPPSLVDSFRKTCVAMDGAEKGCLLKDVPFVLGIPHEAQNNNHKSDKENKLDKLHRAWPSQALQALRVAAVFGHAMNGNDIEFRAEELFLRLFALLGDLETKTRDHRKGVSMPHAVVKNNPLFGKDNLAVAALQQKVNKQGGYNNNNNFRGRRRGGYSYSYGKGYGHFQGGCGGILLSRKTTTLSSRISQQQKFRIWLPRPRRFVQGRKMTVR